MMHLRFFIYLILRVMKLKKQMQIELQGSLTRGATVVDFESSYPNCSVVVSSINEHYKTIFLNTFKIKGRNN